MTDDGRFLVLDGVDGAGKSTQAVRLAAWLRGRGRTVVECRDPGTTPAGNAVRALLLSTKSQLGMPAETLLYLAARAQLVEETVRPALARGDVVVCDRYELSTLAYQGHAGGVDVAAIRGASALATGGLQPDWTGVLDIAPAAAAGRRSAPADRIEQRGLEYQRRVREGFRTEAARHPERVSLLAADGTADEVFARIRGEVERVLDAARRA